MGPPCIAVIGSSTASGHGLSDPAASWVALYARSLRDAHPALVVKNLAVSGFTSFHVLPTSTGWRFRRPRVDPEHNVTAALDERPVALIVNLPSNDAAAGYSFEETMQNLHAIVDAAAQANVPAWVTTPQPRRLSLAGVDLLLRIRRATLSDFGAHALEFWKPLAGPDALPLPGYLQEDGVHPNAAAHALLFEAVRAANIPAHLAGNLPAP